ncbi:MAG: tol-pal system-associated acyl-CoA thioesterase [Gammaproteobacteria bacterium]|nr:tol-pal system-associated acyl-CoA thioesterase [Gammaproteobacteria bacterium]
MSVFEWPVRVYWEDTDAGGVVYYANYLRFLERCRTEWLRSRGIAQRELAATQGVQFMVLGLSIDYKAAARLDDALVVTCDMQPEGRTTAIFDQKIWRESVEGGSRELLIEARVRVVCVDAKTLRPRRIGEYLS